MKMHAFSYIFGRFMVLRTMKFSILRMEKPRKNIVFCMHMHTNTYIFREPFTKMLKLNLMMLLVVIILKRNYLCVLKALHHFLVPKDVFSMDLLVQEKP